MTEVEELVPNGEFSWEKRGLEFDGAPTAEVSDISDYDDRRAVDVEAARGNVYAALDAIDKVA